MNCLEMEPISKIRHGGSRLLCSQIGDTVALHVQYLSIFRECDGHTRRALFSRRPCASPSTVLPNDDV